MKPKILPTKFVFGVFPLFEKLGDIVKMAKKPFQSGSDNLTDD